MAPFRAKSFPSGTFSMANIEVKPAHAVKAGSYTTTQRLLHWTIFSLIAAQYAVGSIMPHIGRNTQDEGWVNWHLSIGAAVLFFVFVRLMVRIARPVALLDTGPKWQRQLASATHVTLYVLIVAMCLLGWAAASSRGWDVILFGFIPLPSLAAKGSAWAHSAGDVHDILLYVLLVPIALHMFAAFYHQFVLRDRLLDRMSLLSRD
jgi:cytochrome b561